MERARKMVIVPEDAIERAQSTPAESTKTIVPSEVSGENSMQTPGDNLSRLDAEMFDILHSKKGVKDVHEKCLNYLQVLRRYLFFRESERSSSSDAQREIDEIEETLAPLTEEAIIDSVPKAYQRKVRLLLRHWKTVAPERLKWSNAGTVSIDGRTVERSNIIELLNDVVRRKRGKNDDEEAPVGRMEFSKFVKTSDTPTNLIGNSEVLKIGRVLTAPLNTAKRRLNREDANAEPSPVLTRRRKAEQTKKKWLQFQI